MTALPSPGSIRSVTTPGHDFHLFFNNDEFYSSVVQHIQKAREEVLIEYYIFDLDSLGLEFLKSLTTASQAGIKVRLLVDGVGSFGSLRELPDLCEACGIEVRVFHPLPVFMGNYLFRRMRNFFRSFVQVFSTVNQRNHRKIVLIDRQHLFIGSQNITVYHSEKLRGDLAWRDTGLHIQWKKSSGSSFSPDFQFLANIMEETWLRAFRYTRAFTPSLRPPLPSSFLRLNSRLYWRRQYKRELLQRIRRAERRIWITNAYFLPSGVILRALKRAARRGVSVAICVPSKSDIWALQQATRSLYRSLLNAGVKIYEYSPRVLHAKTLLIDDWSLVGSHNFNHRSFLHDLEIEAILEEPTQLERLAQQWHIDIAQSRAIQIEDLPNYPWTHRWIGRLIYLVRYWF